eukprot:9279-Heterococcus_DN1.PRE.5
MFFAEVAKATFFSLLGACSQACLTADRAASLGTLGLEGNATFRDVQRAYTTLARQYHPDKAGESEIEVGYNRPFTAKSDEPSLTDIFCCARALILQHWRLVSGSYECLKVLLKSTSVTSDAMEMQLYPDSQEPVSAAHQEHSSVLEDRAVFTRRFRNASSALLTAETEVAAWNTLGQTLLDIDKIGSTLNGTARTDWHGKVVLPAELKSLGKIDGASEHAVKAQLSRFVAQQELNEVKKAHWDHFASLSHDEALFSGCLYEAHGPLRMNETLHGALMNVTLLAAGNLVATEHATNKTKVLVDGANWRRGKLNLIQIAGRYVRHKVTGDIPEVLPGLPDCVECTFGIGAHDNFELKEGKHTLFTTDKWEDKLKRSVGGLFGKVKKVPKQLRMRIDGLKLKLEARVSKSAPVDLSEFAAIF